MSDGKVWETQQSLTMKCPLVTWRQQKYFFFFFLYCAWLQSESLAHIFKVKELKSKPETKSEADKAPISQIESLQKDIETTFCNLHAVIKHNRPVYESCIMFMMFISIRPGIWWCFKKGVLWCKNLYSVWHVFIRSGKFSKLVRQNVWHAEKVFNISAIVWNIIQIQLSSEKLWPGHRFSVCVHCDLDFGDMTLGQGYDTPLVMDNNCVKYYPDPTWQWGIMARTQILGMCALWPWPWRYDLGSRSWHTLGSWATIVWNIIKIGKVGKKLWPGHDVNRRTGWFLYTPTQTLFVGGINIALVSKPDRITDRRRIRLLDAPGGPFRPGHKNSIFCPLYVSLRV